jgi:putative nucleotidyltransferase with HDIG domain
MFRIAAFGAGPEQIPVGVKSIASSIDYIAYDAETIMDMLVENPDVILCYPPKEGMSALEIAQSLRMNYPDTPLYFIVNEKKDFDKKKLIKNGFTEAYLLPWEKADFMRSMKEEAVYSVLPELRDYKPIKVVDLVPDSVLNFGLKIFLPRANKLLQFSSSGDPVSAEKMAKLEESSLNTLFVHKDEVESFRKYTADTLKKLMKPKAMSETDKQEKLEKAVRDLISDMFIEDNKENTFAKSQALLTEVKAVINSLIREENEDVVKKLGTIIHQEENFYLHLSNVSTFAGLFAIVLGFEKPEEMALAGLLHDIGKINLPVEIAELEVSQMGAHALEAYKQHPKYSIEVAKGKKMVLPERVTKAILQHHEAMNGSGFPSGHDATRISQEGRLLAIANTFDHLTVLRPGEKSYNCAEALLKMVDDNSKDPGRMILDIEMLKKLKTFFIK